MCFTEGLPDSQKALEHLKRFYKTVQEDSRIRGFLLKMVAPDCSCKKAEECVVCECAIFKIQLFFLHIKPFESNG